MLFSEGHALIIGVGTYLNKPAKSVPQTAADAVAVAQILQDATLAGYLPAQVTLLQEATATHANIVAALEALAHRAQRTDTIFFYYNGHGEYDAAHNFYLTAGDSEWDGDAVTGKAAVSEADLLTYLKAIPARRVMLFINACYSADVLDGVAGDLPAFEATSDGNPLPGATAAALLNTGKGRVVITACGTEQKSFLRKSEPQTFFGQALAQGLRGDGLEGRNGVISIFDLYSYLYERVLARADELGQVQEAEITIQRGVGPLAVSLYKGQPAVASRDTSGWSPPAGRVREVETSEIKDAYNRILGGKAQAQA